MSVIQVTSEIGTLREVMIHCPGEELLQLVPQNLTELLFDDIPYLRQARREHEAFCKIFTDRQVRVVDLRDLVAETMEAHPELVKPFLERFIREGDVRLPAYRQALLDYFEQFTDRRALVDVTMRGVTLSEIDGGRKPTNLFEYLGGPSIFLLDPIPNLYFTRDMLSTMGSGVVIPRMFSKTRSRETIYTDFFLQHHPKYEGKVPIYYRRDSDFNIEGGDILNLRADLIAVGLSQRTSPEAVEQLAQTLFFESDSTVRKVLAIQIPNTRAYMHLDTVFTQIDRDAFTYHPGIMQSLRFFELTPNNGTIAIREREGRLEDLLAEALELDTVRLFPCAGGDWIAAEREQWNDGSNTLAIAPGVILTYDRNEITNHLLREAGFTVLEMPSYELSKGRGGPRCMSMPLWRENLD